MIARPRRRILTLYWLYNCPLLCFASDDEVDTYRHRLSSIVINGINKRRTQLIRRGQGDKDSKEWRVSRSPITNAKHTKQTQITHAWKDHTSMSEEGPYTYSCIIYVWFQWGVLWWLGISRLEKVYGINNPPLTLGTVSRVGWPQVAGHASTPSL